MTVSPRHGNSADRRVGLASAGGRWTSRKAWRNLVPFWQHLPSSRLDKSAEADYTKVVHLDIWCREQAGYSQNTRRVIGNLLQIIRIPMMNIGIRFRMNPGGRHGYSLSSSPFAPSSTPRGGDAADLCVLPASAGRGWSSTECFDAAGHRGQ